MPAPGGPLAYAAARAGALGNPEATVAPMCYTRTGGASNPCWVCHTRGQGRTSLDDSDLQETYAFSDVALDNHWTNLFVDRRPFIAGITDEQILAWVRTDNYAPLRPAMAALPASYTGFRPDLDLAAGFDDAGLARDGSSWRAVRFQPFLGSFWPTNGSASDVFIRLPARFRQTSDGTASRDVYRLNLSLVEAAISVEDYGTKAVDREIEPVDERLLGFDLDGDGAVRAATTRVRRLPPAYAGGAAGVAVVAQAYPEGTELLHSVRYLDPEAPTMMAARMKELRYMRKIDDPDDWGRQRAYAEEAEDKAAGKLPVYQGDPEVGFVTPWGWQLQGYIEDERGGLRVQTAEEHRFCMGCHGHLGVLVDQTFSFPRKVPGAAGWRAQDLRGLQDRPQVGHAAPELVTYFQRVQGGDETRSNDELLARFFPNGQLAEAELRRAAVGGDRDLAWALFPSRGRALTLDKAYLAIVREQSFVKGRDAVVRPAVGVHARVTEPGTGLRRDAATEPARVHRDGRLHLVWRRPPAHRSVGRAVRDRIVAGAVSTRCSASARTLCTSGSRPARATASTMRVPDRGDVHREPVRARGGSGGSGCRRHEVLGRERAPPLAAARRDRPPRGDAANVRAADQLLDALVRGDRSSELKASRLRVGRPGGEVLDRWRRYSRVDRPYAWRMRYRGES